MVTKGSFNFKSLRSVILIKLETSSRQERRKIVYKVDTEIDSNLMAIFRFKSLYSRVTVQQ